MLTKTTEIGIKALIFLGLRHEDEPITPRRIAEEMDVSPTYLAKTCSLLVKANILRAQKGALGGVTLGHDPGDISLLAIVEACQGQVVGDYCRDVASKRGTCSFHKAMVELHTAMIGVLSRWTLEDILKDPHPTGHLASNLDCRIASLCHGRRSQPS